jgi:outer membrane protein
MPKKSFSVKSSCMSQSKQHQIKFLTSITLCIIFMQALNAISAEKPDQLSGIIVKEISEFKTQEYPVDLTTTLHLIEEQNLLIAQSQVSAKSAKNVVRQKQIALLPDVQGTFVQSRLKGGTQVTGGRPVSVVRPTVQPQLSTTWTIYPGGTQIFDILAAKRRREASEFVLKETYQEQLAAAAGDFYKLQAAQAQREVALQSLEQAEAQVRLSQALFEAGRGTKLDVMRSQNTQAQQKQALILAENAITLAEQSLLNRLNLDPQIHLITKPNNLEQKSLFSKELGLQELVSNAVKLNPTTKQLDQEVAALQQESRSIISTVIPAITLRAYVGATGPNYGDLTRNDFIGLTATANLLQSLGLNIPFQLQGKKLEVENKLLQRKQAMRDIQTQVSTQFINSLNYQSAIQTSQIELQTAEESLRLAQIRFKEGYSTSLEVTTAQIAVTTAKNNLVQAIYNYNFSQVQLLRAYGSVSPANLLNGVKL